MFTIQASPKAGGHKTGELSSQLGEYEINSALGFQPNIADDDSKVEFSWGFDAFEEVDGEIVRHACGIWDYYGNRWSTHGPREVFEQLFPGMVTR